MTCRKDRCGCCCEITGLAHIGVFVRDISRSIDFYTRVLGFECYFEADVPDEGGIIKAAFLRCGTCEIELVQFPDSKERKDGVVDHISFAVSDLEAMMKCLERKGIAFETKEPAILPMLFDRGVRHIFFRGPDGEHLEISEKL
ncbi:MAG: VOC family protein [Christensenellales bacterium]|jgi:lactoylglutathione lyase